MTTDRSRTDTSSHRVVVLAPTPQDADVCQEVLRSIRIEPLICQQFSTFCQAIQAGAGAALIAEEHLQHDQFDQLRLLLASQPKWSDLPVLVLLLAKEHATQAVEHLLSLGHVTLLSRPLRIAVLASTLRAKLRDRQRQYEVRDLLEEKERASVAVQQAATAKSEFLANMSHEIRTPMAAILGYTDLLIEQEANVEKSSYLDTIRRNGNYLLALINDILDISKIEAGRLVVDLQPTELRSLIQEIEVLMELRAEEKSLEFLVSSGEGLPDWIRTDPLRLKQILINLVGNAIKFTEQGRVLLRVHRQDDERILFEVEDTGIGISAAQQSRLFQPFSQGDASIARNFGGSGLGLVISRRLIGMLGGNLSLDSEVGKGTTFRVSIPRGEVSGARTAKSSGREQVERENFSPAKIHLQGKRVLVADDRRDIRFLSKQILTRAGACVTEVEDGQQVLDAIDRLRARSELPDLVLLDMQMPNLDGYEAAARLRAGGYEGPILALTADAMQNEKEKALNAGCTSHLSKPIDQAELLALVAELTNSHR